MSSLQKGHPLPTPPTGPQQQQYQIPPQQQFQAPKQTPEQRQRSKSTFSLRSDRSHKSSGSGPKVDLHESSREKASRRLSLTTKADPRLAMQEAEPSAVASGQGASISPLRAIQHLDANGNPIADPDRSNPTRSRWERPLDTIRSFEAAIDGNYSRKSYMRTESVDSGVRYNRRSSYFGGGHNGGTTGAPKYPQDSYNAGRGNGYRPESYVDNRGINNGVSRTDSYYDGNPRPSNGYHPSRARYPRTASEPQFHNGTTIYPVQGNQQSYETVTTASGSGSSGEPLGYSTDPSSENSSLDRIQSGGIQDHYNVNGSNGFGGVFTHPAVNYAQSGYVGFPGKQVETPMMSGGYQGQNGGPPPLPRKEITQGPPRVPIKLGTPASGALQTSQTTRPGPGEKRKSWFGRRFSKGQ